MRNTRWISTFLVMLWSIAADVPADDHHTETDDHPTNQTGEPATTDTDEPRKPETGLEAEGEDEPRTVNLLIRGEEPDRWNLDLGGGWNEDDGLYARVALSTTNFLGRGEIFAAKVEVGDEHELYEVEYEMPFLFARRQSLGVRLFQDASDHPVGGDTDFDRQRSGAVLSYGRRFGRFHSLKLDYQYADVDDTESTFDRGGEILIRQQDYVTSSLKPQWVYDRLDNRLSPFKGLRLAGSIEISGGALGGESDLVKSVFGLTWFKPLSRLPRKSTLGVRTRLGWLEETGDGEAFAQQRFFSGGENNVRGFRRNSISAVADDGTLAEDEFGFPVGGDRLAQINLEYHLLLGGPFRLVLFADAGGVFTDDQSVDVDRMRKSAGAELRLTFKKLRLPLRLIYANNLDPLPDDRFDDFSLSFGLSF